MESQISLYMGVLQWKECQSPYGHICWSSQNQARYQQLSAGVNVSLWSLTFYYYLLEYPKGGCGKLARAFASNSSMKMLAARGLTGERFDL